MCDAVVVVAPGRVLFAKNSDRDPNEAQLLDWRPRREHEPDARVRCTWLEIPEARHTHAVLLSRPFWMWGAEMGANEHGVVIGNLAVFTRRRVARRGLTGMDLVRLGLERGASAAESVAAISGLLAAHGQGGGCGHERRGFRYHSSFVVADAREAFLLETSGHEWRSRPVSGSAAVSNALVLSGFRERHADPLYVWAADAAARRSCTAARLDAVDGVGNLFALLRDHGAGAAAPRHSWLNGAMRGPCMHAGGLVAASQTTASWVSELTPAAARHWVTATGAPCTALFKPVSVAEPLDLGPAPTDRADPRTLFWRHERLHRRALRDPAGYGPLYLPERDAVEAGWLASMPEPRAAFAEAARLLERWTAALEAEPRPDRRPWYVRRYWARRDRRAGLAA